ncbi:amidohydrolase family protein [Sporomusa sp.]|uniref:amidohydrolase family protein n=1 Tax=Sporomusa sp. TaxID=2078658 RepID=UPI002BD0C418|nr:amidohydrolase family protein [Sporomusa sp.]HWR45088.1 amidohydrolase family protein [Sporomusa sp.]
MIIDGHAHVMLPPQRQIQLMSEAKIDRTILFTSTIHPETASNMQTFEAELNKLYDILNGVKNPLNERIRAIEELAKVIEENPGKYIGFGSIPFGLSYNENLAWIEKYIIANDFRGIGELTPGSGKVSQLEALFCASREIGNLPLWVHTFIPLNLEDIKELFALAKRYPTVPTIIGHLGGMYWLDTLKAIREIPNTYLDLSATFTTIAPAYAIKEYPERTFFSSDAPYSLPLTARTIIEQLVKDQHVLEQVLGGNIARLLQI